MEKLKGVWCLMEGEAYEGEVLVGVFSNRRLALEAKLREIAKYEEEWGKGDKYHWFVTRFFKLDVK